MHPSLNRHFLSDSAWTFSMYLESFAIVPQLYMFQKQAKGIQEVLVSGFPGLFESFAAREVLQQQAKHIVDIFLTS